MPIKTIFVVTVLAWLSGSAWGQQCPDWSPKFDEIDDGAALQVLQSQRNQGWPNFNPANNGGASLQQSIAQGEQLIQDYQQAITRDQQIWSRIGVGPKPRVTAAQCKTMNAGAAMAAVCDEHTNRNALLGIEGMVDLMRCRAGLAQGSYASPASEPLVSGESSYPAGVGDPSFRSGAASVAGLNLSKRADMVNSVTRNWQPPGQQQAAQDSLAHNTALLDPFAESETKGGRANSPDPTNTSGSASADSEPNNSTANMPTATDANGWSDPVSADSVASNGRLGSDGSAYPVPTRQEIADTLNKGISNSGEPSATAVATVANSSNWDQFSSSATEPFNSISASSLSTGSDANVPVPDVTDQQIDRDLLTAGKEKEVLAKILPTNDISDKITDQGIQVIGAVAHQMNHVLNDLDSAQRSNDVSPEQINSDIEGFGPAIGNALVPDSLKGLSQDVTKFQNYVTKKVQVISCLFSFDPYCK